MTATTDAGHHHRPDARRRATDEATGRVDLVGAGPGDPGLLTLHAANALQQAEVVLHDRLVSPEILAMIDPAAERIDVGKTRAHHRCPQHELNALLIEHARQGRYVVRLKGGDPLFFGRGGEELAALAEAGVPARVVPGVSAAGGCSAYAGIPLTHRDHAYRCQFVTAYRRAGADDPDWATLARPEQTVVVYMGLQGIDRVCGALIDAGAPGTRPAALVAHGTLATQQVIAGTLADLPAQVAPADIESPTLLIVGDVVRLREQLAPAAPTAGKHTS